MPRILTVPPDVEAVIGPAKTREIVTGPYPAEYRCTTCGARGLIADGVPLVTGVDVYTDGASRVWFAHATCSPGGVRPVDKPMPAGPDYVDAAALAGVIVTPLFGALPFVLVEILTTLNLLDAAGTYHDQALLGLSRLGMALVTDIYQPGPSHVPGWRVVVPRAGAGGVYGPQGLVVLDAMPPIPPRWVDAVTARNATCTVLYGTAVGVREMATWPTPRQLDHLAAAAHARRIVGVTARVAL